MGVFLLSSFVKKIGAFQRVHISQEIQQYRNVNNKTPVIVIDGINFMIMLLIKHKFDIVECRLIDYVKAVKHLVKKIKELGCSLVFFFDGVNWMQDVEKWIKRKKNIIRDNYRLFDSINRYENIKGLKGMYYLNNVTIVTTCSLLEEGCEVKFSLEDCDSEIVFYAKDNDCLGILAADSDFFINATCNIYSTDECDFESMQFLKFDRFKFLEKIELKEFHLPLFATLVGNDVVPYGFFDYQIKGRINPLKYFNYVSTYIKYLNIRDNICDKILKKISLDFDLVSDDISRLKHSLESYRIKPPYIQMDVLSSEDENWTAIVKEVIYKYTNGSAYEVYPVICCMTYEGCGMFEDFREKDLPPIYEVTKELRRKIYGILLFEKPERGIPVSEMVVNNPTFFSSTETSPIFPTVHHPGLLALWKSVDFDLNKWVLLADAFRVDHKELMKIPRILLVPGLTLKFLFGKNILYDWEIKAFILSAILTSSLSLTELSGISVSKVQSRNMRLCTLVFETYGVVIFMLDALGGFNKSSEYFPTNYQYGTVYHIVYKMVRYGMSTKYIIRSAFSVNDPDYIEDQFQYVSSFVFGL